MAYVLTTNIASESRQTSVAPLTAQLGPIFIHSFIQEIYSL